MDNRQRKAIILKLLAGAGIIALTMLIIIIVFAVKLGNIRSELRKTAAALAEDEDYISAKNSRVFHYMDEKERILLEDPALGQMWLSPAEDVPVWEVDFSKIKSDDKGFRHYSDGSITSLMGVDVSYHNGDIDWDKVAAQGIEFAMIRVGYRGYDEGIIKPDPKFHEYMRNASAAGIKTGVYFFSQAISVEEAIEEADYVLGEIDGYDIPYPVVFDWEVEENQRTDNVDVQTLNDSAAAFCNHIAEGGYIPMIYFNRPMGLWKYDPSVINGFDFWLAEYKKEPLYPYACPIWQYSSEGTIDGISGCCDLDISFVDYSKERR